MRTRVIQEGVNNRSEGQQANADVPEDIIRLTERDPSSLAHIPSPCLVHPEQVRDFDVKVIEDASTK
jgi:hypothetical protein